MALAILGFGVLAPAFSRNAPLDVVQVVACTIMFVGLHVWAQWFLRGLED